MLWPAILIHFDIFCYARDFLVPVGWESKYLNEFMNAEN